MNLYILQRVGDGLTDNYHGGGGLAVVASDLAYAKQAVETHLRKAYPDEWGELVKAPSDEDWATATAYRLAGEHEQRVFIFPDAGCC